MNPGTKDKRPKNLLPIGALGLSICLHMTLLLLIGGAVLIEHVLPNHPFTGDSLSSPAETPIDEVTEEEVTPEESALNNIANPSEGAPSETNAITDLLTVDSAIPERNFFVPVVTGPSLGKALGNSGAQGSGTEGGSSKTPFKKGTLFGIKGETRGLKGYFYDLKQDANQKPTNMAGSKEEILDGGNTENMNYRKVLADFLKNWNAKVLDKYYKAPDPLGTYQFFIPKMEANTAPKAFEVEKNVTGRRWVIHYQGSLTAPVSTAFRFVGIADDVLIVRFNNKIVLDGSLSKCSDWKNDRHESIGSVGRDLPLYAGDWIQIEAGQICEMEVLLGEEPGGDFFSYLFVQEKDKTYKPRPGNNGLVLPLFQTNAVKVIPSEDDSLAPVTTKEGFSFSP